MSSSNEAISERLESIRIRWDIPTPKDFWREVVKGEEKGRESWGYQTVLHSLTGRPRDKGGREKVRKVPTIQVDYLVRVAETFEGVRLEWLLTGRGAMTEAEERARLAEEENGQAVEDFAEIMSEAFAEQGLDFGSLSLAARGQVFRLWMTTVGVRDRLTGKWEDVGFPMIPNTIAVALARPLKDLGIGLRGPALDSYLIMVCEALFAATNSPAMDPIWLREQVRNRRV